MSRVLVTGGAGFIGSHVVDRLIEEGHQVRVLDDLSTGKPENLDPAADLMIGSILDEEAVNKAVADCEAVVHLAAMVSVPKSILEPGKCASINVLGTINVLTACVKHKARRFVQASSSAVYGSEPSQPKTESSPVAPITPYAASKLSAEVFAAAESMAGLSCSSFRFFNVFGPRQDPSSPYSGVVSIFLSRVKDGHPITIFGDGGQSRDFIYVKDVAAYVSSSLRREPDYHEVLNVGTGQSITLLEMAKAVQEALGREVEIKFAPPRAGDIYRSAACIKSLRSVDSHQPLSFLAGIEETARFFSSQSSPA